MRGFVGFRLPHGLVGGRCGARCYASSAGNAAVSPASQGSMGNPLMKAALTSCSMSMLGDCLAQLLSRRPDKQGFAGVLGGTDVARLARMGGFGLLFYGPYQYYWYRALDTFFPTKSVPHFLSKVFLNQTALAPVVLSVVFAWNMVLTGQASKVTGKIKLDLVPTMVNGWKFWVPASSLNFWAVPLRHQVLYMSTCSVLWTAYLSHASNSSIVESH